ncbi:MAG: hypothetical protein ACI8R4_001559 [Paracoccaceae bacterium]|jgi:uncharacterized protein (DUF2147 family)
MKHLILSAVLGLGLAGMAAADPVDGTWKTVPDDNGDYGHINVGACGSKICGTLVRSFDSSGAETHSSNVGKKIVWDMVAQGDGYYSGGKIWSPDRDKTYKSKMTLSGSKLSVEGCVMMICRDGGTWSRVN